MELVNRLKEYMKSYGRGEGDAESPDVLSVLTDEYGKLLALAQQIRTHAESAPYPHVAQRLRQIALEKERNAGLLREKILSLGRNPGEPKGEVHPGKNHWARLVQDIKDQKEIENRLQDDSSRLELLSPEISDLLRRIMAQEVAHEDQLRDLVARADPLANQS